jgi:hypothetical protein
MHPITWTYIGLRIAAAWHLELARVCLRAAGQLGPLPCCRVVKLESRRRA